MDLHVRGDMACGVSVRANTKGLPRHLLPNRVHLNKHEFKMAQKDNPTFTVWNDTKPVCVLSNFHDPIHRGQVTG
mgnify:CR=1 FL=1